MHESVVPGGRRRTRRRGDGGGEPTLTGPDDEMFEFLDTPADIPSTTTRMRRGPSTAPRRWLDGRHAGRRRAERVG